MPRDIPVANGKFLVNFDAGYCLRDVHFPSLGKDNHSDGRKFRFGIWCDGSFEWVEGWNPRLAYTAGTMETDVRASSPTLGVELLCRDLVDHEENILIRRIELRNGAGQRREVRLFFHQDFNLFGSSNGDTAYYDPDEKAIIHYKKDCYFLISAIRNGTQGIDQYATGVKEFRGLEGTWRDAEDGTLEGNPIAQGPVDSTLGLAIAVEAGATQILYYWICAGSDYGEVSRLNKMILGHGVEHFRARTINYWKAWLKAGDPGFDGLSPEASDLYRAGLITLRTNVDSRGAIIAGHDSDIRAYSGDSYGYMWPRDGALAAYALSRAGYESIPRRFFEFCLDIMTRGKESVSGCFLHKYNSDGSLGSSWHPWVGGGGEKILPIQEDSTALVIWALWEHFRRFRDVEFAVGQYEKLVVRCGDFLAGYRDAETGLPLPCYDLWEERWGTHTFTVAAVHGGLAAAARFAAHFGDSRRQRIYERAAAETKAAAERYLYDGTSGRYVRSLLVAKDGTLERDPAADSSHYALFYFGMHRPDDERVVRTMNAVRDKLRVRTGVGGIARYEDDAYQRDSRNAGTVPGNPWFISTLWLAQWDIAKARTLDELAGAREIIEWTAGHALTSGVLAEQLDPFSGRPLSVAPLTWSHACYASTVLEFLAKLREIKS
jgi:GH15 family glucan-1,4-alpha-glucosidase